MNKDAKIASLERKLNKSQEENKKLKSEVRTLKSEKRKESKKKRRQERNSDKRTITVTFEPIERYTFPKPIILTAVLLCMYAGCSPREAVKCIEVFNFMFHGLLGRKPCHTTIRTWLEKFGLDTLEHKQISLDEAYAIIMDASISVNKQQMLLALKVPADHTGKPLTHSDEEVVGMAVSDSWTSDEVAAFGQEIINEQKHAPEYFITDNGGNLKKAIEQLGIAHHKDISHTLAMFLKQVYDKDPEYVEFKRLVGQTKHLALSGVAYLMPSKQRSIARFMNMFPTIDWAVRMLQNFSKLNPVEQFHFSFIPRNANLVEELNEVLSSYEEIMRICKQDGLSKENVVKCRTILKQRLLAGSARERLVHAKVLDYLDRESLLLTDEHPVHNITSDLIESEFGLFKAAMPSNKICGFTASVLYIPIRAKLGTLSKTCGLNIGEVMKRQTVGRVKSWKDKNLRQNPMIKRRNILST